MPERDSLGVWRSGGTETNDLETIGLAMATDLLRTAAQVSGVWRLAAFAIAALIVYLASRKGRVPSIAWLVVAFGGLLSLVPIAGSMYVRS
jgi:hypothetical protein